MLSFFFLSCFLSFFKAYTKSKQIVFKFATFYHSPWFLSSVVWLYFHPASNENSASLFNVAITNEKLLTASFTIVADDSLFFFYLQIE